MKTKGWGVWTLRLAIVGVFALVAVVTLALDFPTMRLVFRDPLTLEQPTIQLGEVPKASRQTVRVAVTNNSHEPLALLGATTTCACVAAEAFPVQLLPGETKVLQAAVTSGEASGAFRQEIVYYTNSFHQPALAVTVEGQCP